MPSETARGLWITIQRADPLPTAARTPGSVYVRVTLPTVDGGGFRIVWAWGEGPRLERSADLASWTHVGDIAVADGGTAAGGSSHALRFLVMRANSVVSFRASLTNAVDETGRTVADVAPGTSAAFTGHLVFEGQNVNASVGHFLAACPTASHFVSAVRPKFYYNVAAPVPTVVASAGVAASMVDTGSDFSTQYRLDFTSDGTTFPIARTVKVSILKVGTAPDAGSLDEDYDGWTSVSDLEAFRLMMEFLPDQVTVMRAGEARFRNSEGQFSTDFGMLAVRVRAGMAVENDDGSLTTLWYGTRMIGWLNIENDTDPESFAAQIIDRIAYELMVPLGINVIADDACVYFTARQLVEQAGFDDTHLYAGENAPSDCWTCDGENCRGTAGHIRTGAGLGDDPLWEFTEDMLIWDCLQRLRAAYGMFCGVTSTGLFEFQPWILSGARDAWSSSVKQEFGTAPGFASDGTPLLNEFIGQLTRHVSRREVRNIVVKAGLAETTQDPLVARRINGASIVGSYATAPPPGYMGRGRAWIERSALYSIAGFTDDAAARAYAIAVNPLERYSPLTCFAQPLFPLDFIAIDANRTRDAAERYYIGGSSEAYECVAADDGGAPFRRYLMGLTPYIVPYVPTATGLTAGQAAQVQNNLLSGGKQQSYAVLNQSLPSDTLLPLPS